MGFHVYCLTPPGHAVPQGRTGLERQPVSALAAGDLSLWVTEHAAQVAASLDALRIHNDVVNAGMTPHITPVPVRYGQWFTEADEAAERVAEDAERWRALLDVFAGRAEYGIRVLQDQGAAEQDVQAAAAETGREYMAALARKQAQAAGRRREGERVAAIIAARAGGLAAAQRIDHAGTGAALVTLAHLVAWSDVAAYREALNDARSSLAGTELRLTGPWPPYSFVE